MSYGAMTMAFAELQSDGLYFIYPTTDQEARDMRNLSSPRSSVSGQAAQRIVAAYERAAESELMAEMYRQGYQ